MKKLRIGAPGHLASRPLVFGLMRRASTEVELLYDEPDRLASRLERGNLDAALIPSIEFLRGVGHHYIQGPGLIASHNTRSLTLVTNRDLATLDRIAVNESSRTTLAALRITLDKLHQTTPDFCVFKGDPDKWCEAHDGVLLTGDRGFDYWLAHGDDDGSRYDIGQMWAALFPQPLVLLLWAFNDEKLADRLRQLLVSSRDLGLQNLSLLSDGIARTAPYEGTALYDYFATSWKYHMDDEGEEGLKLLEHYASEYQLIRHPRLEKVLTP